ncbi:MAG: helix-turn-helix transcriptional regulator [Syntrophomonadaceae bacterium]|nr:helix-turn-helix transcriptional regulator [Syntrophomonadaceae bacterium]
MDDLQKHITESLTDSEFNKAWQDSEYQYQVSRQLVLLRLKRGLTQKQLAHKIGTSQSVIARIENGEQNISLKTLSKLAKALEAELEIRLLAK